MGSSFARRAGYIILSEESMQRSGAWLVRAGEPFRFPGEDIFLGKKIRPSALPAPLFRALFRSPAMNTLTPVQFGGIVVSTCSGFDPSPIGDQRIFFNFGFHSLPHSHVTHATAFGIREEICRSHVAPSREVTRIYSHRDIQRLQRAYAQLPWLMPAAA